jgi:hypothetical protein
VNEVGHDEPKGVDFAAFNDLAELMDRSMELFD